MTFCPGQNTIRMIVVGNQGVGKTQMMLKYTENTFSDTTVTTVGIDFKSHMLEIQGVTYRVQIWDTAGQERFRNIVETYYRRAEGIALVYDVTKRDTFDALDRWFGSIIQHANTGIPIIICGNKCDQESVVPEDEASQYAASKNCEIFITSAKNGQSLKEAFQRLAELIVESNRATPDLASAPVEKTKEEKKKRSFCTI
jgi:small GTP-binding protein